MREIWSANFSIPNFTEFYSEDVNKGMECIRLLNEIIGLIKFDYWFGNENIYVITR